MDRHNGSFCHGGRRGLGFSIRGGLEAARCRGSFMRSCRALLQSSQHKLHQLGLLLRLGLEVPVAGSQGLEIALHSTLRLSWHAGCQRQLRTSGAGLCRIRRSSKEASTNVGIQSMLSRPLVAQLVLNAHSTHMMMQLSA